MDMYYFCLYSLYENLKINLLKMMAGCQSGWISKASLINISKQFRISQKLEKVEIEKQSVQKVCHVFLSF
mgnify:CR=1 FL=1